MIGKPNSWKNIFGKLVIHRFSAEEWQNLQSKILSEVEKQYATWKKQHEGFLDATTDPSKISQSIADDIVKSYLDENAASAFAANLPQLVNEVATQIQPLADKDVSRAKTLTDIKKKKEKELDANRPPAPNPHPEVDLDLEEAQKLSGEEWAKLLKEKMDELAIQKNLPDADLEDVYRLEKEIKLLITKAVRLGKFNRKALSDKPDREKTLRELDEQELEADVYEEQFERMRQKDEKKRRKVQKEDAKGEDEEDILPSEEANKSREDAQPPTSSTKGDDDWDTKSLSEEVDKMTEVPVVSDEEKMRQIEEAKATDPSFAAMDVYEEPTEVEKAEDMNQRIYKLLKDIEILKRKDPNSPEIPKLKHKMFNYYLKLIKREDERGEEISDAMREDKRLEHQMDFRGPKNPQKAPQQLMSSQIMDRIRGGLSRLAETLKGKELESVEEEEGELADIREKGKGEVTPTAEELDEKAFELFNTTWDFLTEEQRSELLQKVYPTPKSISEPTQENKPPSPGSVYRGLEQDALKVFNEWKNEHASDLYKFMEEAMNSIEKQTTGTKSFVMQKLKEMDKAKSNPEEIKKFVDEILQSDVGLNKSLKVSLGDYIEMKAREFGVSERDTVELKKAIEEQIGATLSALWSSIVDTRKQVIEDIDNPEPEAPKTMMAPSTSTPSQSKEELEEERRKRLEEHEKYQESMRGHQNETDEEKREREYTPIQDPKFINDPERVQKYQQQIKALEGQKKAFEDRLEKLIEVRNEKFPEIEPIEDKINHIVGEYEDHVRKLLVDFISKNKKIYEEAVEEYSNNFASNVNDNPGSVFKGQKSGPLPRHEAEQYVKTKLIESIESTPAVVAQRDKIQPVVENLQEQLVMEKNKASSLSLQIDQLNEVINDLGVRLTQVKLDLEHGQLSRKQPPKNKGLPTKSQ